MKLIIVGANNFQLPLIKKAKEMGIQTHVFAWETGAVGKEFADFFYPISITEKEIILDKAKHIKPDGVISIGSDLASITVNYIASNLGLIGNSLECTIITTDKYLMRKKLSISDLPCPAFTDNPDVVRANSNKFEFPLIVKPADRSGSRGITLVNNEAELEKAIKRALEESLKKSIIIEKFVVGKEYSVEMLSWQGNHHFIQITEKETTGPPFFVEKSQHQPAPLSEDVKQNIIDLVTKSLDALKVTYGASHSEIIITSKGNIYITEIGARMGGDYIGSDLVFLSCDFDFVKAVIEVALNIKPNFNIIRSSFSGVYFIFPKNGKVTDIKDFSFQYPEIVRSEIYVNKNDIISEINESGLRPACFIYKSNKEKFCPSSDIISIITE